MIEEGVQVPDEPAAEPGGAIGAPRAGSERISVGSGDENVAKIQLAARWAEEFAPPDGDTLDATLARFRRAYTYIDSVSKLVDPEGL